MKAQIAQLKEARGLSPTVNLMTKTGQAAHKKFMRMHDKAYKAIYRQFLPEKVKIQDLNRAFRELKDLHRQVDKFFDKYSSPIGDPELYLASVEEALDEAKWEIKDRNTSRAHVALDSALTNLHKCISLIV